MRVPSGFLLFMLAGPFMAHGASAATTSFDLTDFSLSTTVLNGVGLSAQPGSAPALPASNTFTLVPDPAGVYLPRYDGRFLRYTFQLPTGFRDLEFTFETLVNDTFALYVNGTVVAIQATTTTVNFVDPLPGFSLNAAGTATDTSGKLEYLMTSGMQSLFVEGTNELTLFGTDTLLYGGISEINGSIAAVPEPAAMWMLLTGLGLTGLAARRRVARG
jgi:hypothetical protein